MSLQARWYYAGEHAADLAAVDAKRSSKQAQHAQEIAQMEARHKGHIAELELQLEQARRYTFLRTVLYRGRVAAFPWAESLNTAHSSAYQCD